MNTLAGLPPTTAHSSNLWDLWLRILGGQRTIKQLQADVSSLVDQDRENNAVIVQRNRTIQCLNNILMGAADGIKVVPRYISPDSLAFITISQTRDVVSVAGDTLQSLVFHAYLPAEFPAPVGRLNAELRPGDLIILRRVTVLPQFRNRRVASQLLTTFMQEVDQLSLSLFPFTVQLSRNFPFPQASALFSKFFEIQQLNSGSAVCRPIQFDNQLENST